MATNRSKREVKPNRVKRGAPAAARTAHGGPPLTTPRSRSAVTRPPRKTRAEPLTKADGFAVAPVRIRPSYVPYLHAHLTLVEEGKAPTVSNLARVLGIRKQTAWEFLKRHPDCQAWIDGLLRSHAEKLTGMVLVRTAHLAIAGSVQHAELHLKAEAGYFRREAAANGAGGPTQFIINNLIPRPEPLPVAETVPAALSPVPVTIQIPTLALQPAQTRTP